MDDVGASSFQDPTPQSGSCPYPGLCRFEERDARLFFGRETETAEILARLEATQLVVVHGASGCGKSSVVQAGVLPFFRRDALANRRTGTVVVIRPSDPGGPIHALAQDLNAQLGSPSVKAGRKKVYQDWSELLVASADLPRDIGAAVATKGATLCLVIDQFEEIFQIAKTGQQADAALLIEFLTQLNTPAEPGSGLGSRPLSVIVTMRSDYLGECSVWDGLAETVNRTQYLLPKISTVGLLRAIHKPAIGVGSSVREEVADRLLPVIATEMDGLPVVQHALMCAWKEAVVRCGAGEAAPDEVTLDDLDAIGGPTEALARHAGQVLARATGEDAQALDAAEWIFRSLSEIDADGKIIRRACKWQELLAVAAAPEATVRHIVKEFRLPGSTLLGPDWDVPLTMETLVDVRHEALLRRWPWINNPSYDETGRPRGLAYRENQDGMIWRSLVVQGEELADGRGGVLGPAATQDRLSWYANIEKRPYWARRHGITVGTRFDREREWKVVSDLMRQSRENLLLEEAKLDRELQNSEKIKRSRTTILVLYTLLIAAVIVVGGVVGWGGYQRYRTSQQKTLAAQRALNTVVFQNQLLLANTIATRQCYGESDNADAYQTCLQQKVKSNFAGAPAGSLPSKTADLPLAPFGGGRTRDQAMTSEKKDQP